MRCKMHECIIRFDIIGTEGRMNNNRLLIVGRFICCATEVAIRPAAGRTVRPPVQGRINLRNFIQNLRSLARR